MSERRKYVEDLLRDLLRAQIAVEELEDIFEDARRYRALRYFVDETDLGAIIADGVYPEMDLEESDEMPPAPLHCTNDSGEMQAAYGLALDSLADFLEGNRNAGKTTELREVERRLASGESRSARKLTSGENASAKSRAHDA